jgi:hypothetical protein
LGGTNLEINFFLGNGKKKKLNAIELEFNNRRLHGRVKLIYVMEVSAEDRVAWIGLFWLRIGTSS